MHYLSYASALCDELSSSSDVQLMPVLKEQIFSILPEMALEPEDPSASGVERWVAHTERLHRSASLSSLRSHFREVLMDYHSYHENVPKIALSGLGNASSNAILSDSVSPRNE